VDCRQKGHGLSFKARPAPKLTTLHACAMAAASTCRSISPYTRVSIASVSREYGPGIRWNCCGYLQASVVGWRWWCGNRTLAMYCMGMQVEARGDRDG
jgi:hypothetical protein